MIYFIGLFMILMLLAAVFDNFGGITIKIRRKRK